MKRILLVDDEDTIRTILAEILMASGFVVVQAASGDRAIELLDKPDECDLVITDIQMPGMADGLALADRVARDSPRMPVLIMTGRPDLLKRSLRSNERFLAKPFGANELLAKLGELDKLH